VTRAGRPEPFRVERMGDFQRIWIGDPDALLTRNSVHRYVVTYHMDRMARPSADGGDELYWNATGNYWDFPVLTSVARVRLPEGAEIINLAAYTGDVGSSESAVTVTRKNNTATFRTQRVLEPGEGMTFAVSFQKGIIVYPQGADALVQGISDMRDTILPAASVIFLLLYYFGSWLRVGRDPP